MNNIPQVKDGCVLATIEKISQVTPDEFAAKFMTDLVVAEQQNIAEAIIGLATQFFDEPREQAKLIASVGLVWKAIDTTIEAEEMNEAWA